jgi:uncharacterized phage-associated protein
MFNIFKKYDKEHIRGNTNTYDVMDVSAFIINYCDKRNQPIENIRLQKLLYLVQAYFVTETKEKKPLFNEHLEAWKFGPVVPASYYCLHQYEYNKIRNLRTYETLTSASPKTFNRTDIALKDREMIQRVVDKYANYKLSDLVGFTQSHKPWSEAYGFGGMNSDKTITIDSIRDYFKENPQF